MKANMHFKYPALAILLLSLSNIATAGATITPAQVREQILINLQKSALYRDRVNWSVELDRLKASKTDQEANQIVSDLIAKSTGGHGFWAMPSPHSADPHAARVLSKGRFQEISLPSALTRAANHGVGSDHIAWIEVPAFKEDIGSTPQIKNEQKVGFAESLQSVLRAQDVEDPCGWIVDLRNNSGGNMWPMLLGLAPLLSNESERSTVVGYFYFSTHSGQQPWGVQKNSVSLMDRQILRLKGSGYTLRHPNQPVAVLLGRSTASSGEAIGLAFRGSSRFRSFGQRTAGYSTGNRPIPLADGSILLLTETVMLDRNSQGNAGAIFPEVEISSEKEAEANARSWLLSQASCRRRVPAQSHQRS